VRAWLSDIHEYVDEYAVPVATFVQYNRDAGRQYVVDYVPCHGGMGPASATGASSARPL